MLMRPCPPAVRRARDNRYADMLGMQGGWVCALVRARTTSAGAPLSGVKPSREARRRGPSTYARRPRGRPITVGSSYYLLPGDFAAIKGVELVVERPPGFQHRHHPGHARLHINPPLAPWRANEGMEKGNASPVAPAHRLAAAPASGKHSGTAVRPSSWVGASHPRRARTEAVLGVQQAARCGAGRPTCHVRLDVAWVQARALDAFAAEVNRENLQRLAQRRTCDTRGGRHATTLRQCCHVAQPAVGAGRVVAWVPKQVLCA